MRLNYKEDWVPHGKNAYISSAFVLSKLRDINLKNQGICKYLVLCIHVGNNCLITETIFGLYFCFKKVLSDVTKVLKKTDFNQDICKFI